MHLTVRDVARLLKKPEQVIYRWIDEGEIPCYWVSEQPGFNRTELLEWATSRRIAVDISLFRDEDSPKNLPSLVQALTAGGIHFHIKGKDRETVLRAVVGLYKLPDELDREMLLQVMLAREASGSTAVGHGIAIPHVRQPIALPGGSPVIALCFLDDPIDFGAADHQPVHTLFSIISSTIHGHLQLLARLSAALHDAAFKAALLRRAPAEEILREAARLEANEPSPRPT
ncbi:MAG TPA: PTS sugar transporter subunit IIA [Myxococcales bacterium]|jgi:PTS system nitrogen regulatory IIA component